MNRFDVAVAGAGPAGSAAATALARKGFSVLLLDKQIFPREKLCGDFLSPLALPLLEELGVLAEILALGPRRITAFRISALSGAEAISRFPAVGGRVRFGLALARRELDYLLLKRAERAGASIREGCRVSAAEPERSGWTVTAESGGTRERFGARLLIGADGRNSRLAAGLGLRRPQINARSKVGVQIQLRGVRGIGEEVQIHLFPGGYAGLVQLRDDRANLCFAVKRERLQASASIDALLKTSLSQNPRLREVLGRSDLVGPVRSAYPVYFAPQRAHGGGVLLVGDAARVTEPVTGEGVFFALTSAALAAKQAERAFDRGDFSATGLSAYERACHSALSRRERLNGIIRALVYRPSLAAVFIQLSAPRFLLHRLCSQPPVLARG